MVNHIVRQSSLTQQQAHNRSMEQRAADRQAASRRLAELIGMNPAVHLQPSAPPPEGEDVEELCIICHMENDVPETVSVRQFLHYFHTNCIDSWHAYQLQRLQTANPPDEPRCPCCREILQVAQTYPDIAALWLDQAQPSDMPPQQQDDNSGSEQSA